MAIPTGQDWTREQFLLEGWKQRKTGENPLSYLATLCIVWYDFDAIQRAWRREYLAELREPFLLAA